jgi:hypothetical protein
MHRRLAQIVALILAMAGIVNAQCLASCVMPSASTSDHACCPHHKNSGAPCSHSTAEMRGSSTVPAPPAAVVLPAIPELLSPQFQISVNPRTIPASVEPPLRISTGILRI